MKVKGNHPLAEVIAKCLLGIETVPKEYMSRMVNRASKKAKAWHKEEMRRVLEGLITDAPDCFSENAKEIINCLNERVELRIQDLEKGDIDARTTQ